MNEWICDTGFLSHWHHLSENDQLTCLVAGSDETHHVQNSNGPELCQETYRYKWLWTVWQFNLPQISGPTVKDKTSLSHGARQWCLGSCCACCSACGDLLPRWITPQPQGFLPHLSSATWFPWRTPPQHCGVSLGKQAVFLAAAPQPPLHIPSRPSLFIIVQPCLQHKDMKKIFLLFSSHCH